MNWTVYLFSDTGRELFKKTFPARDEADAMRKGLALVKPHLRLPGAEDWVVEPAMGRTAARDIFTGPSKKRQRLSPRDLDQLQGYDRS